MTFMKTINSMSNPNSFTFCSNKCYIKQNICKTCVIQNESKTTSTNAKDNRENVEKKERYLYQILRQNYHRLKIKT
jgi:hypothetical protein